MSPAINRHPLKPSHSVPPILIDILSPSFTHSLDHLFTQRLTDTDWMTHTHTLTHKHTHTHTNTHTHSQTQTQTHSHTHTHTHTHTHIHTQTHPLHTDFCFIPQMGIPEKYAGSAFVTLFL